MNGNDLMDALSGIDPKYIDEAAYELHSVSVSDKKVRRRNVNRGLIIALPIAAAVLLTVTVALPALIRMGGTDSTTAPVSDSAVYESEAGDTASETEAPAGPDYYDAVTAEAPSASEESADSAKPDTSTEAATADAVNESASALKETGQAVYEDGLLRIDADLELPEDVSEVSYSVSGTDENGLDKVYAEGSLDDVMVKRDPLTLDLSGLTLPDGAFTLTVGGHDIEFIK